MLRRFTARFYTDLNKQQLQEKLKSGALLIDVRNHDVEATGKLSYEGNTAHTLPLPEIESALRLSPNQFKQLYGFDKPNEKDVVAFSCRAGRRSVTASLAAEKEGYVNVLNYTGGSNDWFK
ncbi:hypothetical protein BASA81_013770 [Batrachochytrium salamandrivorans]|nr:hypothetical protein BASA81_013770 [Batrachochytrium salamandrivorans]